MNALVAAAGSARARFDRFAAAAARLGGRIVELSEPGADIRVGVIAPAEADLGAIAPSPVLQVARAGPRVLAAIGSGLCGRAVAGDLLAAHARGLGFLDGAPEDVAAIAADPTGGTLALGATVGGARLFVAEPDGGLLVSTHVGLLAAALGAELRTDRSYEDFLLGFGFLPDGRTCWEGVRAEPAATVALWPGGAMRAVASAPVAPIDPPADAPRARAAIHDAFFAALEEQAAGHRRHAVLLGGLDSALVAAGLRRMGHAVDAYTFAFGDPKHEQRGAERMASALGLTHRWVRFTPDIVGADLERFPDLMSQPAAQPHYQLHTLHACRVIAADGHDHVFSGDGCDATFLGYPTVSRRARLVGRLAAAPKVVRRAALGLLSAAAVDRRLGHVARMGRSTLRSLELPWPARGHLPTQYLDDTALARLRLGQSPPQRESVRELRLRLADGLDALDPVRLAFHGNALTGQSRAKVEGSVATTGVAQMSPFLHPGLRGLAAALPVELLRPAGSAAGAAGKAILIDMVRERELLPEFVLDLPKQSPSDSPIDRWYAGPLRPLVERLLERLPFEHDRGYVAELLAPKRAEDLYRERISLGHHALQVIGLLCTYAAFAGRAR